MTEVLATYWPVLAVAFGVSWVMTPLCRRFALAHRIVDRPDDFLKPHKKPIAYLGGVAIFLGWTAGLGCALGCGVGHSPAAPGLGGAGPDWTLLIGVFVAAAFITAIGLLDDIRHVSPMGRLAVTLALGVLLMVCGVGDDWVLVFARQGGLHFLPDTREVALAVSAPLTLFIIVGACNATNVLDGMDGLCGGVLGIVYAGYAGLAIYLLAHGGGGPADVQRVILSLAAMGAVLGFLPHNRHPATIFMGDAGSMFLGLNAAVLILLLAETAMVRFALAGLVVFALPVVDMALAMFRRWRAGRPMMQGDRSHFYDQLVDRGWSVPRVAAIAYAWAAGYVLLGWAATFFSTGAVVVLYTAAAAATVLGIVRARMVRPEEWKRP